MYLDVGSRQALPSWHCLYAYPLCIGLCLLPVLPQVATRLFVAGHLLQHRNQAQTSAVLFTSLAKSTAVCYGIVISYSLPNAAFFLALHLAQLPTASYYQEGPSIWLCPSTTECSKHASAFNIPLPAAISSSLPEVSRHCGKHSIAEQQLQPVTALEASFFLQQNCGSQAVQCEPTTSQFLCFLVHLISALSILKTRLSRLLCWHRFSYSFGRYSVCCTCCFPSQLIPR